MHNYYFYYEAISVIPNVWSVKDCETHVDNDDKQNLNSGY